MESLREYSPLFLFLYPSFLRTRIIIYNMVARVKQIKAKKQKPEDNRPRTPVYDETPFSCKPDDYSV